MAACSSFTAKSIKELPPNSTSQGTASALPKRRQAHEFSPTLPLNLHDAALSAGIVGRQERVIMDGSDIGTIGEIRIGRIIAVSASQAVALIEKSDTDDRSWPVEMGALVKLHTRVST